MATPAVSAGAAANALAPAANEIAELKDEIKELKVDLATAKQAGKEDATLNSLRNAIAAKEQLLAQARQQANAADSSSGKKRKSLGLPSKKPGSQWTPVDVAKLHIVVLPSTQEQVIAVDAQTKQTMPQPSDKAVAVLSACASIDSVVVDLVSLHPDDDRVQRVKGSPTGWTLLKYLSLILGSLRMDLESVVDDFLIHLLVALGYNDGDLVILSKNNLALKMDGNTEATADISIYNVRTRFRLVVFEEKKEQVIAIESMANFEAQLIAEALAAVQANEALAESKKQRSASADDAAAAGGGLPVGGVVQSGPVYMLRVVGAEFSFYSMQPQQLLMDVLPNYEAAVQLLESKAGKAQLPVTSVLKLNMDERDTFKFTDDKHRVVILRMLSAILSNIMR